MFRRDDVTAMSRRYAAECAAVARAEGPPGERDPQAPPRSASINRRERTLLYEDGSSVWFAVATTSLIHDVKGRSALLVTPVNREVSTGLTVRSSHVPTFVVLSIRSPRCDKVPGETTRISARPPTPSDVGRLDRR
jgi:hypothetical protein